MGTTPLADNAYLKRRRGKRRSGFRWYVRVPVPTDIQEVVGKQTIERALNTSDINEARKLKHIVLADIFAGFERARGRRITSADIEHEAQRHLRERLEQIQKAPEDTFEMATDSLGNEIGLYGDMALAILREEMEGEDWSASIIREADKIGRSYGDALTPAQREELYRQPNPHVVIINADSGAIITQLPTGAGVDTVAFNPKTMEAIATEGGDGTMTFIKEKSPTSFVVEQTLPTKAGARTVVLDDKTGHVLTQTLEYGPVPADAPAPRPARGPAVPGSFTIIEIGR